MRIGRIFPAILMAIFILIFQAGCGGEEETTQKSISLPPPLSVHTLDIKWPVGVTINYDVSFTSETHYYYLREGESLKEYDADYICKTGFAAGNTPNNNWDYTDQLCSYDDAGKSPLVIKNDNFTGNLVFKIYGKVDEDISPCASGCQLKTVYYYTSLEAKGDNYYKEIVKDAWYYDTGNSVWKKADDILENSDTNFTKSRIQSYFLALSGFYYIDSNTMGPSYGTLPGPVDDIFDVFNIVKYQPWKDSAWPSPLFGGAIARYEGKDYLSIYYNGSLKNIRTYKVNLFANYNHSDQLIENYIRDCLDTDQYGYYDGFSTDATRSNLCLNSIIPVGSYWVDSHNIMVKLVGKITSVSLMDAGYDCIYIDGNGNKIRVSDVTVDYDVNGLPQSPFDNCNPDNIRKFIAYQVTDTYVILTAKDWQQ